MALPFPPLSRFLLLAALLVTLALQFGHDARPAAAQAVEVEMRDSVAGTHCQRVDASGVGVASIVEAGFVYAVDVWGEVPAGVQLCLAATGSNFRFLDAKTSPRAMSSLTAWSDDGKTCATLPGPGTLVLMPGPAPAAGAA
ncbi:MAG: hypothetical protein OXB89_07080, partial [Anaerolineaceae bacterium]|nr:hypothetical protein [Anaerolineaceae bacterium]